MAPELVGLLATRDAFADVSLYRERQVPFFKRAQLAVADVARAGVAELHDLNRPTAFADNLVPHVLRLDGVLRLDPDLTARIEAGELLVTARAASGESPINAAEVDAALWNRGRESRYKAVPRPRSRNMAYCVAGNRSQLGGGLHGWAAAAPAASPP